MTATPHKQKPAGGGSGGLEKSSLLGGSDVLDDITELWLAQSRIAISEPKATSPEPELPRIAEARERDREARARLAQGPGHQPSAGELLEVRAWKRGRR